MVTKEPLKKFRFKVKISGICSNDRYLDMGLVSKTRKNACANLINSFGSHGNYSYCGYAQSGMTGPMLSSTSTSGFEEGTEVFIDFNGGKLCIYTEDRKADLNKDLPEGEYFLFFVLYHKEASCVVSRLA